MTVLPIKQPPIDYLTQGAGAMKYMLIDPAREIWLIAASGAPANGEGNGWLGKGSLVIDGTNGDLFQNTGTLAATVFTQFTSATDSPTFVNMILTGLLTESAADALTAHAGGTQALALALTKEINRVTTVAAPADSVKLPPAAAGLTIMVINSGANPMQVFGAGTDTIDDVATATGVSQMVGSVAIYVCSVAGKWYTEGLGTGWSGSLQTLSNTGNITARSGGTQALATALTSLMNRVSTVAAQGDSVALPAAVPGLAITVINTGANPMQVFGAGTDTINGIATATGIAQGIGTTAVYECLVAGNWIVPLSQLVSLVPQVISGDATIPAHVSHTYVLTKGSAAAITLGAPTAGTDDGLEIVFTSASAFAHVITATGLLNGGAAGHNTATFAAQLGSGIMLMAYNGKWQVLANVNATLA